MVVVGVDTAATLIKVKASEPFTRLIGRDQGGKMRWPGWALDPKWPRCHLRPVHTKS